MRIISLGLVGLGLAASAVASADARLSPAESAAVVKAMLSVVREHYAHPDEARHVLSQMSARIRNGAYSDVRTKSELAKRLTDELIDLTGDYHFFVAADAAWVDRARAAERTDGEEAQRNEARSASEAINYGFTDVRRLSGNVGYIRVDYFDDPDIAASAAAAAMRFVEHTHALIFDLRHHRGGTMEMVQLLMSYLFPADEARHLFDTSITENGVADERRQWVLASVPGTRRPDSPVYVVTSSTTFSAAEWFAFNLQQLGRAEVVGQRTVGAANPVAQLPIDDEFYMQVPIGVIRDPIDESDFQGTGVSPDVEAPAHRALDVAHLRALETTAGSRGDDAELAWLRPRLEAGSTPRPSRDEIEPAVGRYDGREIIHDGDRLVYRWRDRFRLPLVPLTPTLFAVDGSDDFRFRLVTDAGAVVALEKVDSNGTTTRWARLD